MGARIAASLGLADPDRVRSLVFGGLGDAMVKHELFAPVEPLLAALRAGSLDDVTDPRGRTYRKFADQTGSDREALIACMLGARERLTEAEIGGISAPVLVAVGSEDFGAGKAQ